MPPRKTTVKNTPKKPGPARSGPKEEEPEQEVEPETETQGAGEPPNEPPEAAVATGGPEEEPEPSIADDILNDDTTRTLAEKKADQEKQLIDSGVVTPGVVLKYVDHSPNGVFFRAQTDLLPKGLTISLRRWEDLKRPDKIEVTVKAK